jgi:hypothetical protein
MVYMHARMRSLIGQEGANVIKYFGNESKVPLLP